MRQAAVLDPMIFRDHSVPAPLAPLTVAEAVWLGTAVLHDTRPSQNAFTVDEIVEAVLHYKFTDSPPETIRQHVKQHCVSNLPPRPNRSRMLFLTSASHRRLFREGDRFDAQRDGAPTHPAWEKLPARVQEWYETVWNSLAARIANDPLLNAIGIGKDIWKGVDPDAYVSELRDDWGDR